MYKIFWLWMSLSLAFWRDIQSELYWSMCFYGRTNTSCWLYTLEKTFLTSLQLNKYRAGLWKTSKSLYVMTQKKKSSIYICLTWVCSCEPVWTCAVCQVFSSLQWGSHHTCVQYTQHNTSNTSCERRTDMTIIFKMCLCLNVCSERKASLCSAGVNNTDVQ